MKFLFVLLTTLFFAQSESFAEGRKSFECQNHSATYTIYFKPAEGKYYYKRTASATDKVESAEGYESESAAYAAAKQDCEEYYNNK